MSLLNKDTKSILQQYVLIYLKILEVFFRTFGFENFFNIYICVFNSNFVQIENVKSSRWTLALFGCASFLARALPEKKISHA